MVKYKINYDIMDEEYSKVIYGDSVTGDTPIMLKHTESGNVIFKKIEEIGGKWISYPGFKMFDKTISSSKEYSLSEYKCWSDKGWTDIKKVIRHKTRKYIYNITTDIGIVKVTEDHSLLSENYDILKPKHCRIGTSLLTKYPESFDITYTGMDEFHSSIAGLLLTEKEYYQVPEEIINGPRESIIAFLKTYETKPEYYNHLCIAQIYYLYKKIGINVKIENVKGLVHIIKTDDISTNKIKSISKSNMFFDYVYDIETEMGRFQAGIGEIIVKNTDSCMVELNTKSLVEYKKLVKNYKDMENISINEQKELDKYKTKAIEEAFVDGKKIASEVTKALFKHPINLEFEKVYTNFLILSKKRYIGNYYGTDPYTIDKVETKGVVLKRRDNPEIVKKIYTGVVNPLLQYGERGINISIKFLKNELNKLMHNQVDLKDLVITKSLAKGYGKVTKTGEVEMGPYDYKNTNLPHVSLANKMRNRDPGSAPNIGDRIDYIFVEIPDNPKAKLFEKAESLKVAEENNMQIDYLYYITNQIHNPVNEILKILVDDSEKIFTEATQEYVKKREKQINQAKIKGKLEKGQMSILRWIKPKD
jgi:hypothetical protein